MQKQLLKNFAGLIEANAKDDLLLRQLEVERLPAHVAIIMDGNGRWAARRNLPRVAGHRAGAESVRAAVDTAARLHIAYLTLYAFSTENWKRPKLEVQALMALLKEFLRKEIRTLQDNNIRFQTIGREQDLDASVRREIEQARRDTETNTGTVLSVALNYSGRADILDAIKSIVTEAAHHHQDPAQISEADLARHLYTRGLPDPDLLIRTSGEMRVSNFLLWQIAYSEIYVTETLWPDFRRADFFAAVLEFQRRERRYGDVKTPEKNSLFVANLK
ncbi:MAG: isoprenyl transferase [Acidobacteria bacterium]|nr:isoprenyl transferase [Acidobacteriota bacterium]